MITIKTPADIAIMREGGKRHARILKLIAKKVVPGVSARELDEYARKLIAEGGDKPAFLDYTPYGAKRPFPAALCVSINDDVVHGVPNEKEKILQDGDIVSIDLGLVHRGLITDSALTLAVGEIDNKAKTLIAVTKKALAIGIKEAVGGARVGDIGFAIQSYVRPKGFSLVEELAGHGVGYRVHEDPYVPNFGKKGSGELLRPGMVIAIEPMVNEGDKGIYVDPDGFTIKTNDGSRSAHFEKTVLITEGEAEILT